MEFIMEIIIPVIGVFSLMASFVMGYKAVKKQDISIWGAVIARLYLTVASFQYLMDKKIENLFIAFALILASDVIINILYFATRKHITELEYKQLLLTLNNLTDKYATVVDTAPVGVYSFTFSGSIEYVNKKLLDILGYTKEEMVGKSIYSFIDNRNIPTVKYYIGERAEGRIKTATYDLNIIKKDGTPIKIQVTGSRTENGHPTITGTVLVK